MKLEFWLPTTLMLTTPMLYCALCCCTQSSAAIMSLVEPEPWSSSTSSSTMPALGAPPACPLSAPAAMPAENVPWPRPSPELFGLVPV